jgi:hypothetical protein
MKGDVAALLPHWIWRIKPDALDVVLHVRSCVASSPGNRYCVACSILCCMFFLLGTHRRTRWLFLCERHDCRCGQDRVPAVCRMQGEEQCVRYLQRDSPRWTCKSNYFVTIIWCHVVCVKLMTVATFEVWSRINIAVICATLNTPSGLVKNSFRAATRSPKHNFYFSFYIKYLFKIIYMYIFMKKLYMYIFMKWLKNLLI